MSVFLRQQKLKKGIYLSFVEAFYDANKKNTYQKVIEKIGYLDDLKKVYTDPISYFQNEAKRLSLESSNKYKESKIEKIPRTKQVKNLGYFIVKDVYKRFKMDEVMNVVTYNKNFKFDFESVFRFLVFSQIVNPNSKRQEYKLINQYFDNFTFSEDQMNDAILLLGKNDELIKEYILLRLKEITTINTKNTFFDGTNIYFETDRENEELKRGPEKNGRHDPILGMGLLMDANGIPLTYSLFPGNASEQPELHKNVQSMKKKLNITGRTIITADKGLNSGDNMYKAIQNGDGYVMGQKVRGASKECIDWILQDDEKDPYEITKDTNNTIIYKIKSEEGDYPITITSPLNGQKVTINLHQKRVVFWSKDYADKAAFEREKIIARANQIIANPKAYLKSTVGDAANYIKEIKYDKNGEIIKSAGFILDNEAIKKAKELDGYYMIVTSETKLDDSKIIEIYRGLWEIEETFSIFKGVLKVRPVFAKSLAGIHCHILICFMSLLILRLLQKKFLRKELTTEQVNAIIEANKKKRKHKIRYQKIVEYPIPQICDFIRNYNVLVMKDDYYTLEYHDLIPFIEERYSICLDKKIHTSNNIRKIFEATSQHKTKILS